MLLLTVTFGCLFLAILGGLLWLFLKPAPTYRPGEAIQGLTSELARSLPPDYPRVTIVDVTEEAGISFQHFSEKRSSQLPEDMGSGSAWGDYDKDGWLDLFVVNEVGPLTMNPKEVRVSQAHCALYHNNGDGTFSEVSNEAGVAVRVWGTAAAWGDYDNDGWPDLFVASYGKNRLYHNNNDGTFSDASSQTRIAGPTGFWTGVSWADFNRDGYLDIYVCGYVKYIYREEQEATLQYDVEVPTSINPSAFEPERNLLYRNNGDGTFTEMALQAGVANSNGRSLSASWCDFDDDGWPDLYVANDVSDNALFRNLGNELFEDRSHAAWVADYRGAMGVGIGDWDEDEDMDMFITHWIAQENALYTNKSSEFTENGASSKVLRFMDEADRYGLGQIALDYIGWGTSFFDYDNDSNLDLFVVNGSTFQQKQRPWLLIPMQNQLFWNRGSKHGFYDVSKVSGNVFERKYVGRGAAFGDYDNDGDIDIFVVNNGGPALLLRNDGGNQKPWLKVQLHGTQSNSLAIGAKLRLVTGDTVQVRQVGAQSSYCSQNSLIQHFGLGSHSQADTLEIIWPNGSREVLQDIAANQTLVLVEDKNNL